MTCSICNRPGHNRRSHRPRPAKPQARTLRLASGGTVSYSRRGGTPFAPVDVLALEVQLLAYECRQIAALALAPSPPASSTRGG